MLGTKIKFSVNVKNIKNTTKIKHIKKLMKTWWGLVQIIFYWINVN